MQILKRVQIYLDDESIELADYLARQEGISRSVVVRRALKKHVKTAKEPTFKGVHPFLQMSGIEKSKTGNLSLTVDDIY